METQDSILLSKAKAAQALSISIGSLDALVRQGELRTCRLGRRVLFPRRELEKFASRRAKVNDRERHDKARREKL